jgi:recombination protein RecA
VAGEDLKAAAIEKIRKKYGKAAIRTGADISPVRRVPTGIFSLDVALGVYEGEAGLPKGRAIMLVGHESSCKSLLSYMAIAEFQRRGEDAVLVDAEGAWDPEWGTKLGIIPKHLLLETSESMEQTMDVLAELIRVIPSGIVVVDSFAALAPTAEIEASFHDWQQGLGARIMNKGWRNIQAGMNSAGKIGDNPAGIGPTVVAIQQWRTAIGQRKDGGRSISGGAGQKFAMSIIVSLWAGEEIYLVPGKGKMKKSEIAYKNRGDYMIIGRTFNFEIIKNKTAPPHRTGEFVVYSAYATDPESGFSVKPGDTNLGEQILTLAMLHGIIQRSGAWYSYGRERLGQGLANVAKRLKDDTELMVTLRDAVIEAEIRRIEGIGE